MYRDILGMQSARDSLTSSLVAFAASSSAFSCVIVFSDATASRLATATAAAASAASFFEDLAAAVLSARAVADCLAW